MAKQITAMDIRNRIWADYESWTSETAPCCTASQYAGTIFPDVDSLALSQGVGYFNFELLYFMKRPIDSMKHLYGEHAMLFDVYGCEKHKFIATTHDDHRYNPYMGVYCPRCNLGKIKSWKRDEYIDVIEGRFVTDEEMQAHLNMARSHKKYWAKINRREFFKNMFNLHYLKYQISKLLKRF